ncbi:uncharacterized protein LOC132906137 [Bombus pascuorum]|uniref:uncharacterized protein LOC132906137 n=1 Tax=Bombus pascuorum TaxID=65598 RepID=UPI00298D93D5|nr:uncharacterized protein LOC132906137 [Bombus pascuorum]
MKNSAGNGRAAKRRSVIPIRVPPPEPGKILLWFIALEMHFESRSITDDKLKFNTLIANVGYECLKLVVDIVFEPPATERYEKMKSELIKKLADSNDMKVWKLFEGQKIEDRMPSQFYRDMKRLASTLISNDLILALWKSRLPLSIRLALDDQLKNQEDQDENVLTEKADLIYQAKQSVVKTAANKQSNRTSDTLHDRVSRLEAQTIALSLDSRRRSCAECHRSSSRERFQQPGLFNSHGILINWSNKCYFPCDGNKNQEDATESSVITTYDDDHGWGLIYAKDAGTDYSYLVDTGAARCTFPRSKLPQYAMRARDEDYYLIAANGTRIDTYGPIQVYINMGRKWRFEWQFTVADVISPVIGMDFLQYHGFLVDTRNKCLFKPTDPAYEIICHGCHWGLDVPHKPNPFTDTTKYADLTHQPAFEQKRSPHVAEHYTDAKFGPIPHSKQCDYIDPKKRKFRIQYDDEARKTLPLKLDNYSRIKYTQDDER